MGRTERPAEAEQRPGEHRPVARERDTAPAVHATASASGLVRTWTAASGESATSARVPRPRGSRRMHRPHRREPRERQPHRRDVEVHDLRQPRRPQRHPVGEPQPGVGEARVPPLEEPGEHGVLEVARIGLGARPRVAVGQVAGGPRSGRAGRCRSSRGPRTGGCCASPERARPRRARTAAGTPPCRASPGPGPRPPSGARRAAASRRGCARRARAGQGTACDAAGRSDQRLGPGRDDPVRPASPRPAGHRAPDRADQLPPPPRKRWLIDSVVLPLSPPFFLLP